MDPNKYSWNEKERIAYGNNPKCFSSPRKIKINDHDDLRYVLEETLHQLDHKRLALRALSYAKDYLKHVDIGDLENKDKILKETEAVLMKRVKGNLSTYELRQAGFLANTLAKKSKNDVSKYAARVYAQGIATGHMRAHAIVSSDYSIKVINLLYPSDELRVESVRI